MGIDSLMGRELTFGAIKMFQNEIKVVFAQWHKCTKCPLLNGWFYVI